MVVSLYSDLVGTMHPFNVGALRFVIHCAKCTKLRTHGQSGNLPWSLSAWAAAACRRGVWPHYFPFPISHELIVLSLHLRLT